MAGTINLADLLGSLRRAAGAGAGTASGTAKAGVAGDFAALLAGVEGQPGTGAPAALAQAVTALATGQGADSKPQDGVQQAGATAAELLATRVRLAGGLRAFEAATMQALRGAAAAAGGDGQTGQQILHGAAQALGALLGQADAVLGTDSVARLDAALKALDDGGNGTGKETGGDATGGGAGTGDPSALAGALFALVAQSLGLVRPVADAQPTRSQLLVGAVSPGGASVAGGGTAQAAPAPAPAVAVAPLVQAMVRAGTDARTEAHAHAHGSGKDAAAAKAAGDPFAGLLAATDGAAQSGAGLDITGQAGAGLAAGQAAGTPAAAAVTSAAAAQSSAQSAAQSAPVAQAPAAAFAGFVSNQIRGVDLRDGVTRIALQPRGLGEIELNLRRDDSGRLNVVLRVENPMVLAALRGDQARLAEILSASGMAGQGGGQGGATLDFQSFGGQGGQDRPGRGAAIGAVAAGAAGAEAATPAEGSAARDRIGRDALDITI